jgi:hypothetical protein
MAWLDDQDDFDNSPIPAAHEKKAKRNEPEPEVPVEEPGQLRRQALPVEPDPDANAGSDYDAMPDSDVELPDVPPPSKLSIPNSAFRPARILVNPRCVTTYAGVSHTKLALDLFGDEESADASKVGGKYVLDDWESAPDSFVCQEQRSVLSLYVKFPKVANTLSVKLEEEKL